LTASFAADARNVLESWFLDTEIIICISACRPPQYLEYMVESFFSVIECTWS